MKLYLNNMEHYSVNPQTLPQQYGTLLWQSSTILLWQASSFTSTIRNTTLAILKLYLNNTEHSSGNHETLPQQYGTLPLAIMKLYLNNTEHYSGNPQTLPQQYETLLWQS